MPRATDDLAAGLRAAVDAGILTADQSDRLGSFLAVRAEAGAGVEAARPVVEDDPEAPRFVRGFHDILITIGVVLGVVGLAAVIVSATGDWVVGTLVAALGAWGLAEHLVRRLRLALPAIALSIAVVVTVGMMVAAMLSASLQSLGVESGGIYVFLSSALAAGLFFWRFRVPFSLALVFGSLGAAIIAGYLWMVGLSQVDRAGEILVLVLALLLLAIALAFDFSDPDRRTRRSDYAFWLHLMAAPALIGSIMSLFVGVGSVFGLGRTLTLVDAIVIVVTMAVMAVLAILIDRRAFLVAGLGYLGAAIFAFAENATLSDTLTAAVTVLAVGIIILVLALGWQGVRAVLLAVVPEGLRRRLPPLRRTPPAALLNA